MRSSEAPRGAVEERPINLIYLCRTCLFTFKSCLNAYKKMVEPDGWMGKLCEEIHLYEE